MQNIYQLSKSLLVPGHKLPSLLLHNLTKKSLTIQLERGLYSRVQGESKRNGPAQSCEDRPAFFGFQMQIGVQQEVQ
jgi:hypothetical protein